MSELKRNLNTGLFTVRFLTCGSVDDGKSTMIGRLLHDSGMAYTDHINEARRNTKDSEMEIDFSLLLDGLESERNQGITIDVAYRYFYHNNRKFIIADAPGHKEYTRNMAVAASKSDFAVLLVDARVGIKEQTIRHSYIMSLFGIKTVIVAINKMDLMNCDQGVFDKISTDYLELSKKFNFLHIYFVPICARDGDNIVNRGDRMNWYSGKTILEYLEEFKRNEDHFGEDLTFSVQNVMKSPQGQRIYQGVVLSGTPESQDYVHILPSKAKTKIKSVIYPSAVTQNFTIRYKATSLILEDEVDIDRGSFIYGGNHKPIFDNKFSAYLVWFDEKEYVTNSKTEYYIKINHNMVVAKIHGIRFLVDINNTETYKSDSINLNDIAFVDISTNLPVIFDNFDNNRRMGSFLLIDKLTNKTVASGLVKNDVIKQQINTKNHEYGIRNVFRKIFRGNS